MPCHVFHMGPQDKCIIRLNLMSKAGSKIGFKTLCHKTAHAIFRFVAVVPHCTLFSISFPSQNTNVKAPD